VIFDQRTETLNTNNDSVKILDGRVALVTGAARGIGRATAEALAGAGAAVAINDFGDMAEAEAFAADLGKAGVQATTFGGDISDPGQVAAMVEHVEAELGKVSILVNNAGITRDGLVMRMSEADFDAVIATNLRGTFLCSKAVARGMMRARSGAIINLASVVGRRGNAGQANYAAAKAGIIGLTKTMARELGPRGVTVNAVAPGYVQTAMTEKLDDSIKEKILENTPLGRLATPEEIASVILFLASPAAAYITGAVVPVDGGMGI
jgi:3-oxoacyl-[acyl-carrier protein] reductase